MKQEYDVIIIGAGPAGLSCAIELQNSGKTILLLEKKEAIGPKVCAGGITTKIEDFGIPLNSADKVFSTIKMGFTEEEKTITYHKPFVATIDREKLGKILLEKISGNVDVKTSVNVTSISNNSILVNGEEIKYKYLVGADGGNSIVRKFLGLKTEKFLMAIQYITNQKFKDLELSFDPRLFGWGYAWIFPHKDYTSIGCGQDVRFPGKHLLKNAFTMWLKKKNITINGPTLQGQIINFDYRGFDFGNIFLVGDAAGLASGVTGEGIYPALVSSKDVAKKIIDPNYITSGISEILKIKRKQEFVINLLHHLSAPFLYIFFKFCFYTLKFRRFKEKAIKLYS